jgi:ABC-type glycerol-3-phosphate transport system permease component
MPIIPVVGRKSFKIRSLIIFVYTFLILGSITTVYPFALMFSTSLTSHADHEEYRLIPRYMYDDEAFFLKYLESKNKSEHLDLCKLRYHLEEPYPHKQGDQTVWRKYGRYTEMAGVFEQYDVESPEFKARVGDWIEFVEDVPATYRDSYFHMYIVPGGYTDAAFQQFLKERYPTIEQLKAALPENPDFYCVIYTPFEAYERHAWYPPKDMKNNLWVEFKTQQPPYAVNVMTTLPIYQEALMDKFADVETLNDALGSNFRYFWQVPLPVVEPVGDPIADWDEFVAAEGSMLSHASLKVLDAFDSWSLFLSNKYGDIEQYNAAYGSSFEKIRDVTPPETIPGEGLAREDWIEYYEKVAPPETISMDDEADTLYRAFVKGKYGDVATYNETFAASISSFDEVACPRRRPRSTPGAEWVAFMRRKMPMRYVTLDTRLAEPAFVEYAKAKYTTITRFNNAYGSKLTSWDEVTLSERMPESALELSVWQDFYETKLPLEAVVMDTADVRYANFLAEKYGDVDKLNETYGTGFRTIASVEPPWREVDYWDVKTRKGDLFRNFLTRNYVYVIKRVFLQGRPILNTFILVTLTVLAQITINPLAAYALSRYKLSYSSKVLIFMLATMAFPAQVTMIPNFLMIKRLGLMNTFGALILPGLANGYYVFLLKGFFDSLPQELYEAASIDGASEFKMFYMITLPLSLPVLSVIALYAFGMAYGSFLWALTTCQDKSMWTLMVFLQQFQLDTGAVPYVMMAALILAAIPTIVVFLSAQKVLMRGIVVPTMK